MIIAISQGALKRADSGPVVAGIWLSQEQAAFPTKNWTDFAVVVLTAFVEAILRAGRGGTASSVYFMEGPFAVRLAPSGKEMLHVQGFKGDDTDGVLEIDGFVDFTEFAAGACACSEQLLGWCRERGWAGRDDAKLAEAAASLAQVIRSSAH
jgi:hypothetical protein